MKRKNKIQLSEAETDLKEKGSLAYALRLASYNWLKANRQDLLEDTVVQKAFFIQDKHPLKTNLTFTLSFEELTKK